MGYITSARVLTTYEIAQVRWKRIHSDILHTKAYDPKTYIQMDRNDGLQFGIGFSELWQFKDIFDPK